AAKKKFEEIRGTPEGLKLGKNGQPVQRQFRNRLNKLQQELNLLADPAQHGLATHGVRDSKTPADTAIRIRGEEELHGPLAARGFLTAFTVEDTPAIPEGHSGRLE